MLLASSESVDVKKSAIVGPMAADRPVTAVEAAVAAIVIEPVLLVMVMPEPAVRVALVNVLPVVLPINSWPLVYVL